LAGGIATTDHINVLAAAKRRLTGSRAIIEPASKQFVLVGQVEATPLHADSVTLVAILPRSVTTLSSRTLRADVRCITDRAALALAIPSACRFAAIDRRWSNRGFVTLIHSRDGPDRWKIIAAP
jgi:hypothetical protein